MGQEGVPEMQDTLYVGVDAHKKRSHIAVMDQGGTVLKSVDIASSRPGVAGALGRYRRPIKAVLEASYAWEPMHDCRYGLLPKGIVIESTTRLPESEDLARGVDHGQRLQPRGFAILLEPVVSRFHHRLFEQ
jgi:hypothetical protein